MVLSRASSAEVCKQQQLLTSSQAPQAQHARGMNHIDHKRPRSHQSHRSQSHLAWPVAQQLITMDVLVEFRVGKMTYVDKRLNADARKGTLRVAQASAFCGRSARWQGVCKLTGVAVPVLPTFQSSTASLQLTALLQCWRLSWPANSCRTSTA